MGNILVSGLINIETTLLVDGFPIKYTPVRYPFFNVNTSVSGVGYNIAKALTVLGDNVNFLSLVGRDILGEIAIKSLEHLNINSDFIVICLNETPASVILYDKKGQRQINVDLKDIQDKDYPAHLFENAVNDCDIVVLCNINFSRPFLKKTKKTGKLVATDVHAISSINDEYNHDFMKYADILFMSDELIPCDPKEFIKEVQRKFKNEIIIIGMGGRGCLIAVRSDNKIEHIPPVFTREIINTIGAGDALFSAFVHYYSKTKDPYQSIKMANIFASYKIGQKGAADGFINETAIEILYCKIIHNIM